MDIIDLANDQVLSNQAALMAAAHEAGHAFDRHDHFKPRENCLTCDDPISEARRVAAPNALRCTECQAAHEADERKKVP